MSGKRYYCEDLIHLWHERYNVKYEIERYSMLMNIFVMSHKRHEQDCYTLPSSLDPGHMPVNFKTALHPSTSFTVILVKVDDFLNQPILWLYLNYPQHRKWQ